MLLMKRIVCILAMAFVFLASACYAGSQKLYTMRDGVYRRVESLTRRAGLIGPSSFAPASARVLEIALERIDPASLSGSDRREWAALMDEVSSADVIFSYGEMGADLSLEGSLQVNAAPYSLFDYTNPDGPGADMRNEALVPYRYEAPFARLGADIYFTKYLMLTGEVFAGNNDHHMYESSLGWLVTSYDGSFRSVFSQSEEGSDLAFTTVSMEIPRKAGISAGNDFLSVVAGRFPHSIGSGLTGNLVVGDNYKYQEIATVSFLNNYFTYNISVTHFDGEQNAGPQAFRFSRSKFNGDQQYRVVHRFDLNFFNRLRLAVDLSTLFRSSGSFDLRFFFPMMFNHNLSNFDNELTLKDYDEANNMMGLTVEAALARGLSASFQFVLDQAQTPLEESGSVPAAWGLLANLKWSPQAADGALDFGLEFVYTNPNLYLNGKRDPDTGFVNFNLDYVNGYYSRYMPDYGYSGYISGPDTMALALTGSYRAGSGMWELGGMAMYRIHGSRVIRHTASSIDDTVIDMSGSVISPSDGEGFISGALENAEHRISLMLYSSVRPVPWMELGIAVQGAQYFNHPSHGDIFIPQLVLAMKVSAPFPRSEF